MLPSVHYQERSHRKRNFFGDMVSTCSSHHVDPAVSGSALLAEVRAARDKNEGLTRPSGLSMCTVARRGIRMASPAPTGEGTSVLSLIARPRAGVLAALEAPGTAAAFGNSPARGHEPRKHNHLIVIPIASFTAEYTTDEPTGHRPPDRGSGPSSP